MSKNIIVIEDNKAEARILMEYLKSIDNFELNVKHFDKLEPALLEITQANVDLILSDLTLPDSVGIDTFVKLRSKFKNVPLIITTNMNDPDLANKVEEIGAVAYKVKSDLSVDSLNKLFSKVFGAARDDKPKISVASPSPSINLKAGSSLDPALANYDKSGVLLKEHPLSRISPDIYNEFYASYKALLEENKEFKMDAFARNFARDFAKEKDAFVMVALAPADLIEMHEQALKDIAGLGEREALKALREAMRVLKEAYS